MLTGIIGLVTIVGMVAITLYEVFKIIDKHEEEMKRLDEQAKEMRK